MISRVAYRYELRRGDDIVATGHLLQDQPLTVGERISIGRREGIVRAVEPVVGESEMRLVVQLVRDPEALRLPDGARPPRAGHHSAVER